MAFVIILVVIGAGIVWSVVSMVRAMRAQHRMGGSLADRPSAPDSGSMFLSNFDRDAWTPQD